MKSNNLNLLKPEKEMKKLKEKILLVAKKTGVSAEIVKMTYDDLCMVWGMSDIDFETLQDAVNDLIRGE